MCGIAFIGLFLLAAVEGTALPRCVNAKSRCSNEIFPFNGKTALQRMESYTRTPYEEICRKEDKYVKCIKRPCIEPLSISDSMTYPYNHTRFLEFEEEFYQTFCVDTFEVSDKARVCYLELFKADVVSQSGECFERFMTTSEPLNCSPDNIENILQECFISQLDGVSSCDASDKEILITRERYEFLLSSGCLYAPDH